MANPLNQDDTIPDTLKDWAVPEHVNPLVGYIGGRESSNRANIMQGGNETFDITGPHPNRRGEGGTSKAVGLSGFIPTTWNSVAGENAPMTLENQRRATYKHASMEYNRRTGRDLAADMQERGLDPAIVSPIDAAWLGVKTLNGAVTGNGIPGARRISVVDALKMNGADEATIRANLPPGTQVQTSQKTQPIDPESNNQDEYTRRSEKNLPYRQTPEKVGLLGMLGVPTTENERLAGMKAGFRMMGTVGNLSKVISEGGLTYVDTLAGLNKQTADIAGLQTTGKANEDAGYANRAKGIKELREQGPVSTSQSLITPKGDIKTEIVDPNQNTMMSPNPNTPTVTNAPTGVGGGPINPDELNPIKAAPSPADIDLGPLYGENHALSGQNNRANVIDAMGKQYMKGFNSRNATVAEPRQRKFESDRNEAQATLQAGDDMKPFTNELMQSLSSLPSTGKLASGPYQIYIAKFADAVTGIAARVGVPINEDQLRDLKNTQTANITANKIITQIADRQGGGHAAIWLTQLAKNLPSPEMDKSSAMGILANQYVQQARNRDYSYFIDRYGKATTGYANDSYARFNELNPREAYADQTKAVKQLLMAEFKSESNPELAKLYKEGKIGANTNLVDLFTRGYITPQQFNKEAEKVTGAKNMSRIF